MHGILYRLKVKSQQGFLFISESISDFWLRLNADVVSIFFFAI
jgi:hypothetical protein